MSLEQVQEHTNSAHLLAPCADENSALDDSFEWNRVDTIPCSFTDYSVSTNNQPIYSRSPLHITRSRSNSLLFVNEHELIPNLKSYPLSNSRDIVNSRHSVPSIQSPIMSNYPNTNRKEEYVLRTRNSLRTSPSTFGMASSIGT